MPFIIRPQTINTRPDALRLSVRRGTILLFTLIFGSIGIIIVGGLVSWGVGTTRVSRAVLNSEMAFQIAEAGVSYYRWHLAHAPDDYQDGTGLPGPYLHEFEDKNGVTIGYFSLDIVPPPDGSTVVVITSTGYTVENPEHERVIRVTLAIPSLARYAVAANADMRFGEGTTVSGQIHSNGGIRFDGTAYNVVTSAKSQYNDPDHSGGDEFGVHTHDSPIDPLPPAEVPNRTDIFVAGREFPVPAVDFDGITGDFADIKEAASDNGHYFAASGALGYRILLKTDDTFDVYVVNVLRSPPSSCSEVSSQPGWGTWSIGTGTEDQTFLGTYANPANHLIFLEDNVWVEGQIQTARLTIAAARFPETPATYASITVNNDLRYTTYDGNDVLALMAQGDFNVGLYSEDDLQIDAALVAKNGRAGRYYYESDCGAEYRRNSLTSNGMIATNQRYGFAYTDDTGYELRNLNYDSNLLYSPPPSFPLTGNQYNLIDWQDVTAKQ